MSAGRPDPQRIAALFEALVDLEPAAAEQRLAEACGGDRALQDAVRDLLAHDQAASSGFPAPLLRGLGGTGRTPDPVQLGRYSVLHRLGEGGMGLIYAGYDAALRRRVALKVLRRREALGELLLREGQALGRLAHPNVVSVHEVGEHEGHVFLAMELIEGPTLRAWLDDGPRPFADTLRLFLQAGRGLAAVHQAGLVHRDFKPENVLIGPDGRARVADFGIVALAQTAAAQPSVSGAPATDALPGPLTQTGVLMGTPTYMAPEQFRGQRATPLSDQFSFCVALYRAAYGTSPHPAADLAQLTERLVNEPPAPPPRRPEVPTWLAPIILRGLEREPALRFASMTDLLAAITHHLPRDPELDPTGIVRERLVLGGVFITGYVLSYSLLLIEPCARLLLRPAGLIAAPLIMLVIVLAGVAWAWRSLSRNSYGRRFAGLFVISVTVFLGHRLISILLRLTAEQMLIEEMLLFAALWALTSLTFERWFAWLSAIMATGAVLGVLLPGRVPLLMGLLGLASVAIIAVRLYVDRHLSPAAIVGPEEELEGAVGSPAVSADD